MPNRDELYEAAVDLIVREGRGSVSLLQRALGIGYGRAARLVDYMAEDGIVGQYNGSQAREVLLTLEQWEGMGHGGGGGGGDSDKPAAPAPKPAPAAKVPVRPAQRVVRPLPEEEPEEEEEDELPDDDADDEADDEQSEADDFESEEPPFDTTDEAEAESDDLPDEGGADQDEADDESDSFDADDEADDEAADEVDEEDADVEGRPRPGGQVSAAPLSCRKRLRRLLSRAHERTALAKRIGLVFGVHPVAGTTFIDE